MKKKTRNQNKLTKNKVKNRIDLNKIKQKISQRIEGYGKGTWYKIFIDIITILGIIIGIVTGIVGMIYGIRGVEIAKEVRNDTAELTKLSDKPIYYGIKIYPNENTKEYEEYSKYVRLSMDVVVDDYEIYKEDFIDVNYNSTFTHIKYFMVYDYNLEKEADKYYYTRYKVDDRIEAQMRLENKYNMHISETNYSLTPNKNFCYMLIYTETSSQKNLDLVFFKYNVTDTGINLEVEEDNKGAVQVSKEIIGQDELICSKYFTDLWSQNDTYKKEDIEFMFDVYKDLREKLDI